MYSVFELSHSVLTPRPCNFYSRFPIHYPPILMKRSPFRTTEGNALPYRRLRRDAFPRGGSPSLMCIPDRTFALHRKFRNIMTPKPTNPSTTRPLPLCYQSAIGPKEDTQRVIVSSSTTSPILRFPGAMFSSPSASVHSIISHSTLTFLF